MLPSEALLQEASLSGSIDPGDWARALDSILARLDHIVHDKFPLPVIHAPASNTKNTVLSNIPTQSTPNSSNSYNNSNKENAPPSSPPQASSSTEAVNPPQTPTSRDITLPEGTLPPPLLAAVTNIKTALSTTFASAAPHTIQRLAELLLYPTAHYRYLPSYLNALDRVVAVSSSTKVFPLPTVDVPQSISFIGGGVVSAPMNTFGSDESLGGALLTPISWLREAGAPAQTETQAEGSPKLNGVQMDMTSEDGAASQLRMEEAMRIEGAVTQGELLRQEQETSSPPLAVGSLANTQHTLGSTSGHEAHAQPHGQVNISDGDGQTLARGPEQIGLEDTGPQGHSLGVGQVLDMEAAVGRPAHAASPLAENEGHEGAQGEDPQSNSSQQGVKDSDGDTVIVNVDGLTDEETELAGGDSAIPDAMDTTAS